jgi:hypothetical protein
MASLCTVICLSLFCFLSYILDYLNTLSIFFKYQKKIAFMNLLSNEKATFIVITMDT